MSDEAGKARDWRLNAHYRRVAAPAQFGTVRTFDQVGLPWESVAKTTAWGHYFFPAVGGSTYQDAISSTGAAVSATEALQAYVDAVLSTAVGVSAITDAAQLADAVISTGGGVSTITDQQAYVESVQSTVVSVSRVGEFYGDQTRGSRVKYRAMFSMVPARASVEPVPYRANTITVRRVAQ